MYRTARLHDLWDRLGAIGCPVDVVFGSESLAEVAPLAAELTDRLPHGRLTLVDGAGHLLPMERPAELAAIIASA